MRKTTMAQVVEFAGQLNVTLQNLFLAHWNAELVHDLGEPVVRFGQSVREIGRAHV